ncbi:GGDEF domain-containing protein [Marinibactrum halimedae]|uniref:diguanylate cyclase n=1 Tax=Marinibactrum halimedae TaxID=1444977 RepID=A0AA37T7V8_9GAMM|nr:GGDEF domain-containing protein [Marinibactrum halimedae]MCD9459193.1 GGDEF domain-containing protein [Marinibactrum halimedae]GLS27264.1 hypothetical protein GCM10007877_29830 [Marinibactrum halimedae]
MQQEYQRFVRSGNTVSLIMFDIDHFKKVNDTYGHQPGDDVIKSVASLVLETKRDIDIAGRYGGEEFGIILANTCADSAKVFAERLRQRVEQTVVDTGEHKIQFTISLGISEASSDIDNYKAWLKQADAALYASKRGGRNQSSVYKEGMEME